MVTLFDVQDIMEKIAQKASFIGNPSPAAERRSSEGIAFTAGEVRIARFFLVLFTLSARSHASRTAIII